MKRIIMILRITTTIIVIMTNRNGKNQRINNNINCSKYTFTQTQYDCKVT